MAQVFPFRPYRYAPAAGPLERLVTQPYDKITPEMQARYLSLSPYNIVRIILGPRTPEDSPADNVYTRAARYLEDWIRSGVLIQEPEPCLLAYFQTFTLPDTGERLTRKGFIGLGAVEDYSAGTVHRHEHTLSGPKQDRLELLRFTRADCGPIFMLYPDPEGAVEAVLDEAAAGPPEVEVFDEYGAVHRLWTIRGPRVAHIQRLMADKPLVIADGHHRYETALAFAREHPELEDARKVMMAFVNLYSPGLRILATHRLVQNGDPAQFLEAARARFRLTAVTSLEALRRDWDASPDEYARLGVAEPQGLWLLEAPRAEGELDVSFLHGRILGPLLGLDEDAVRQERGLRYVRSAAEALESVRHGQAALAFLLKPVRVQEVARVAFSGGVMPQKSTDFYPKLLSGLAIYKFER
ncbi:MAG: DUF1015 domain-containing protein [Bryobacterales bacterium]|nr:DUF1015 domain-containing protein [Bryobacteraceae bacterium]MDW8355631.1 DUF1015 domain-containing protein [Bryobacterales bacterium]